MVSMSVSQILQERRTLRFYSSVITPRHLCFDVGAHTGDRVRVFRKLGARVVAVEPQPAMVKELRERWGTDPDVTIEATAAGAEVGSSELRLNTSFSSLATLDEAWRSSGRFAGTSWGGSVTVPVTKLDELIKTHGVPDFCKIDVEGFEREVLRGLSRPLPLVSFEFTIEFIDRARECFDILSERGPIEANVSL
jgi:FkbM family methyltransferase